MTKEKTDDMCKGCPNEQFGKECWYYWAGKKVCTRRIWIEKGIDALDT